MRFTCVAVAFVASGALYAQSYTVKTVAGGGFPDGVQGTSADIGTVSSVALDSAGNLYMVSLAQKAVLKLSPSGVLTRVAGNGALGFGCQSPGPAAKFQFDFRFGSGVAADRTGNVYIAIGSISRMGSRF
jgi:hypothetical protein